LSENALNFTLYDDQKLVGLCSCYFNDEANKIGYLSGISLLRGYRKQGFGSNLLGAVIEYAHQKYFKEIHITPECKNKVLIHFLEKNMFVKHDTIGTRCLMKYKIIR